MKAIRKEFWREIRNTRSRFLSILILVALAVSFLSGLRSTAPDMKNTGDSYLDAQNFMDIQVMSTLGLTEEDLEVLSSQPHILDVEGIWNIDAFASGPDLDIVVKVWSLPQRINQVTVTDGRLPEAADECAVEENLLETLGLEVGDTLQLKTQGDYADALTASAFTIVGTVVSPYYISVERGTSTLGTGQVSAYVYLPASSFDMDSYTSAFLLVDGARELTAFYSDYTDLVDGVIDALEPLGEERAALRREELVDDANEELEKAQKELDDAKAEAAQELADGWQELLDARAQLDDGWADLSEGKETLAQETADAQKKLSDAKKELADAQIELDDGEQEYAKGVMDYQDGQRETADGWKDYEDGLAEYEDGKKELDEAKKKLDDASATLAASHYQLTTAQNQLQQLLDQLAQPVGQILAQQGVSLPITSGSELLAAMQDETYGPAVRQAMTQVLSILYQASGMASADELLALAQTDPVTAGTIAQFLLPSVNQALEAMGQTPLTSAQELLTRLAAENVEPEPEPEPDPDPNPAPEPTPAEIPQTVTERIPATARTLTPEPSPAATPALVTEPKLAVALKPAAEPTPTPELSPAAEPTPVTEPTSAPVKGPRPAATPARKPTRPTRATPIQTPIPAQTIPAQTPEQTRIPRLTPAPLRTPAARPHRHPRRASRASSPQPWCSRRARERKAKSQLPPIQWSPMSTWRWTACWSRWLPSTIPWVPLPIPARP